MLLRIVAEYFSGALDAWKFRQQDDEAFGAGALLVAAFAAVMVLNWSGVRWPGMD